MSTMFSWREVDPAPGEPVAPDERLPWGRTIGLGAQHVVAMFGATFVFPVVMGLDPNLAILFSGICTILFLLITSNRVPSYLGTSASFVASVLAIRAQGGDSADVTGSILVAGLVLAVVGVLVHFAGSGVIHKVLPPAVTGAVVMLIGFNLAPVVAGRVLAAGPVDRARRRHVHGLRRGAAAGLLGAHRRAPRAGLRLPALLAGRPAVRTDQLRADGPAARPEGRARPGQTGPWREGCGLDRVPERGSEERRRLGRARAELLPHVHPAGAARRDRPDRGEHRPRQGRRGDDQDRPRPLHGPSVVRRRRGDGPLERVRRLADHDVRREHRGDGCDQGLLDGRLLRGGASSRSCSACARSSARSSARRLVACSAASR